MGFFEGLNTEKYDRQYTDRDLMRRIATYFKPQARRLILVTVTVLTIAAIGAGTRRSRRRVDRPHGAGGRQGHR